MLKSYVSRLIPLRRCAPALDLSLLRLLPTYFEGPDSYYPLDSSYEPEAEPHHPEHEAIFATLQKFRAGNLLWPVGEDHLFFAAMRNKGCKLTPLGQFYWRLAKLGRL